MANGLDNGKAKYIWHGKWHGKWQSNWSSTQYPIKWSWHLYFFNDIANAIGNVIVNAINSGIASVKVNLKVHAKVNVGSTILLHNLTVFAICKIRDWCKLYCWSKNGISIVIGKRIARKNYILNDIVKSSGNMTSSSLVVISYWRCHREFSTIWFCANLTSVFLNVSDRLNFFKRLVTYFHIYFTFYNLASNYLFKWFVDDCI